MVVVMIHELILTPLKVIEHPKGNIQHAMKASSSGYAGFGEAYFSYVNTGQVKGWKKHTKMLMNLVVPLGEVRFVFFDDRAGSPTEGKFSEVNVSLDNYVRLTVPAGVWMAFQGTGEGANLLLNISDIEHDPKEAITADIEAFDYCWKVSKQ